MPFIRSVLFLGLASLAGLASARADEPMDGTFLASRACPALVSIRKDTNPGMAMTGPGLSYKLLARNRKKATHYRIELPDAEPPERWVEARCGKPLPAAAAAEAAPATPATRPKASDLAYVLALSWQPAFCETSQRKPECRVQNGRGRDANYFSLHGLWPQPSTRAYCNVDAGARQASVSGRWKDIPAPQLSLSTRAGLETVMPGSRSQLERHEWLKHGTCYAAPDAETYFRDSVRLTNAINSSPVADVMMKNIGRKVTAEAIRAAFDAGFGPGAGERVRVSCKDDGNRRLIAEITIGLRGDIPGGTPIADLIMASPSTDPGCPGGIVDPVGPQ